MTPASVATAEHLRNLADRVEAGEISAIGVCGVVSDGELLTGYWLVDPMTFALMVAASSVLASRVLHGYGVPEAGSAEYSEDDTGDTSGANR